MIEPPAEVERAVQRVAELLAESREFPWKTARYLKDWLRREKSCNIGREELEKALLEHARLPERQIRYSSFPARKTLDLLWGHLRVVNDFAALPDPYLDLDLEPEFAAIVGEFKPCSLSENAPWCFLSHNFHDLEIVSELRNELIQRGYGVWLAEAEILHGDRITLKVQEGLKRADRFLIYVSRKSLGSRWVLKEAAVANERFHLPATVVLDSTDHPLLDLFQPWVEAEWEEPWLSEQLGNLLRDFNEEHAASMLPDLLAGALKNVPRENRRVVLYPPRQRQWNVGIETMDQAFPTKNRPRDG